VRTEDGLTVEAVDIRRPVGLEMTYEVFEAGHELVPCYKFFNQDGLCLFVAYDVMREWRGRPRPIGRFTSTAWVPGNLLSEGTVFVSAALISMAPYKVHFHEGNVVGCQVVDTTRGDSARGDWDGSLSGVVRPLLRWDTEFTLLRPE
jgi:lipopolysaccharide transport system ATP-binding protein